MVTPYSYCTVTVSYRTVFAGRSQRLFPVQPVCTSHETSMKKHAANTNHRDFLYQTVLVYKWGSLSYIVPDIYLDVSDPNPDVGGQPTIDEVITAYNVTRLSTIASSRLPQRLRLLFLHRHAHQTLMSLMKMKMRLALQATVSPSPPQPLCQLHECRPISLYL